ncbi:Platinum sensitivity protein [Linnemannia gamsii]|uniref:Platinum sensitivity protein n=1 Tax=Linnemannia gamsii TaxID=64522 RepID=A0ABQ7K357_9FUNG|nr:Platinum sensitivity protein [Linnemannia gamsii]
MSTEDTIIYSAPNDKQSMLLTKRKHDNESEERVPVQSNKRAKGEMSSHQQHINDTIEEETRIRRHADIRSDIKHALDDTAEDLDDDYALAMALSLEYYCTTEDDYALAMSMSLEDCATEEDFALAMTLAIDEELCSDYNGSTGDSDDSTGVDGETDDNDDDTFLPYPTVANLPDLKEFLEAMKAADNVDQRELIQYVVEEKYIDKLVNLFETCEKEEKTSCLRTLRDVIVLLMHRDDSNIMKEVVKDCNFFGCLGILEYDTELAEQKADYRQMFSRVGKVKEVVPIEGPHTLRLINQVIRLQFLMVKVLPGTLEDDAASAVTLLTKAKSIEAVQDIIGDHKLMKDLFEVLKHPSEPKRRRNDVVLFIHQLCRMAEKTTVDVYSTLCPLGFFGLLEFAFVSDDLLAKHAGIETLHMALKTSPRLIRAEIVEQASRKGSKVFLDALLIQAMVEPSVRSMVKCMDAVQGLLDVNPELSKRSTPSLPLCRGKPVGNTLDRLDSSAEAFLDLFYTSFYFSDLVEPLLALKATSIRLNPSDIALCKKICQILSFLVQQYPSRLKPLLVSKCLAEKIAYLFKNHNQHLRLVALKFFRVCMDQDDDDFHRLLIQNEVIHSVVELLHDTKGNKTPTNWTCLEFFEHLRKTNIRLLVMQCSTLANETMGELSHVPLFRQLWDMRMGKFDIGAIVQPPQGKAKSGLSITPPHSRRPFIKDAYLAKGSEADGSPAGTPNGSQEGAGLVKELLQELFVDDDDREMTDAESDTPQSILGRRKREDTDFKEYKNAGDIARELPFGKRKKLD